MSTFSTGVTCDLAFPDKILQGQGVRGEKWQLKYL